LTSSITLGDYVRRSYRGASGGGGVVLFSSVDDSLYLYINLYLYIYIYVYVCVCRITKNIQKLEILLVLLEGKLDSITWLEASPEDLARAKAEQEAKQKAKAPAAPDSQPGVEAKAQQGEPSPAAEAAPVVAAPVNTVSKDPRYKKYFGLLERGVPKGALGPRMTAEGLDVKYLDTPDAPAPDGAPVVESSEEEEEMSDISD
jgi:hypothetical protein